MLFDDPALHASAEAVGDGRVWLLLTSALEPQGAYPLLQLAGARGARGAADRARGRARVVLRGARRPRAVGGGRLWPDGPCRRGGRGAAQPDYGISCVVGGTVGGLLVTARGSRLALAAGVLGAARADPGHARLVRARAPAVDRLRRGGRLAARARVTGVALALAASAIFALGTVLQHRAAAATPDAQAGAGLLLRLARRPRVARRHGRRRRRLRVPRGGARCRAARDRAAAARHQPRVRAPARRRARPAARDRARAPRRAGGDRRARRLPRARRPERRARGRAARALARRLRGRPACCPPRPRCSPAARRRSGGPCCSAAPPACCSGSAPR